jgi:hypothetical protein
MPVFAERRRQSEPDTAIIVFVARPRVLPGYRIQMSEPAAILTLANTRRASRLA